MQQGFFRASGMVIHDHHGSKKTEHPFKLLSFPVGGSLQRAEVGHFRKAPKAGDEALKRDLRAWAKHSSPISADAIVRNLDQRDLLLSTAIGLSDAALCRRFSSIGSRLLQFGRRLRQDT